MTNSSISTHGTSLVFRLQENDAVAWDELVELYAPLVFHWCSECRLQSCDSADVMQEVFASVSKSIHRFQLRPGSCLRGWLWSVTQNKIRDFFRNRNNYANAVGGTDANLYFDQLPFDSSDPPTGDAESSRLVSRALEQIKDDFQLQTWTAFCKVTLENQDTRSVAAELGLTPNSVRQAKSRVLRRLREQLGDV